jgi:hypothetical protein
VIDVYVNVNDTESRSHRSALRPSFGRHDLTHRSPAPPPRGGSGMFDDTTQPSFYED